jgi:hypothetical protein
MSSASSSRARPASSTSAPTDARSPSRRSRPATRWLRSPHWRAAATPRKSRPPRRHDRLRAREALFELLEREPRRADSHRRPREAGSSTSRRWCRRSRSTYQAGSLATCSSARSRPVGPRRGLEVDLGMKKGELAMALGTVPETLSRAFGKLKDDGIVEVRGSNVIVLGRPRAGCARQRLRRGLVRAELLVGLEGSCRASRSTPRLPGPPSRTRRRWLRRRRGQLLGLLDRLLSSLLYS